MTKAALVGEKQAKQGVRNGSEGFGNRNGHCGLNAITGEGAPLCFYAFDVRI